MLRFGESDTAQRFGETSGRRPLTGIDLDRRRSREIRRLEQIVGSAASLRVYDPRSSRAPTPVCVLRAAASLVRGAALSR